MKLSKQDTEDFRAIYNYLNTQDEMPNDADAIVVGGEWLRTDNAERAADLYHQGVSDTIIFSGYAGFSDNATGKSEAKIMAERAIRLGVPKSAIILDEQATNTAENLTNAAKILIQKGIVPEKVILIHKPYMTRRFKATAEAQWPSPQPSFFVTSVQDNFDKYIERERKDGFLERTLWSMPGDYKRMTDYADRGWQTRQPIDENAEEAFRRLSKKFSIR